MDAAEDNDVRIGFGRLLREPKGIPHVVGHVLNFWHLVIVRQDDGMALTFQAQDLLLKPSGWTGRHGAGRRTKHGRLYSRRHELVKFCTNLPETSTPVKPGLPPEHFDDGRALWQCGDVEEPQKSSTRLGSYELGKPLGRGGMGIVYRARHIELNRWVALKILPQELKKNVGFVERFRAEARAAAKLDHLNLVGVLDAGEADGRHYFAMELIEGRTAAQRLRDTGVFSEQDAIGIAINVAAALAYAWHEARLIHRDVKPENILIRDRDGQVKLADLGLAKSVADISMGSSLTVPGTVLGTLHYISPEQAQGRTDTDFRTDMYSLGATLYHLVIGKAPFHGDNGVGLLVKHITTPFPNLRQQRLDISDGFCAVLGKLVEKDPEKRYPSWELLLEDLDALKKELPPPSFDRPAWANLPATSEEQAAVKSRIFTDADFQLIQLIFVFFLICAAAIWFFMPRISKPIVPAAPPPVRSAPIDLASVPPPPQFSPADPGSPEWLAELRKGVAVNLFNGRNFVGWPNVGKGWQVKDGVLFVESQNILRKLACELPMDDFELSWQMRLVGVSGAGLDFRSMKGRLYTLLLEAGDLIKLQRWESDQDAVVLAGPAPVGMGWHHLRLITKGPSVALECEGRPTLHAEGVLPYGQSLVLFCTKGGVEFKQITLRSLEPAIAGK